MRIDINTKVSTQVLPTLALMLLFASAFAASARDEPYRVLVLNSFTSSLPVNADWYRGIADGFASAPDLQVEIDTEAPDLSRIGESDYADKLFAVYRYKYHDRQPHLIIPTYTPALAFLLEHGEDLFPGVPIVFLGADTRFVAARQLSSNITGITSQPDIAGTLELALHIHPDTQRVAVIVGSGDLGRGFERTARQVFQPFEGMLEFIWLRGLPFDALTSAVKGLPGHAVVLYLVQLEDRTGRSLVPFNTLQKLASVANAPIYGLWDTLIGSGIIGGRLATLEQDGFAAAQMGSRILKGEAPETIPVFGREENRAIFDGRALARWNIDADRLPASHHILYSQTSLWAKYGTAIVTTGLLIGLQGLLILALLLNRRQLKRTQTVLQNETNKRARAESTALALRESITKFSKERGLGALAGSIAHEMNQPLTAIQNYAQAAKKRTRSHVAQTAKLIELLEKIDYQATRAGDIIQHIRSLFSTDESQLLPAPLYPVIKRVIDIIGPEIERGGCRIEMGPHANVPAVLVDELEIQLVLVNLLQNAAHSMKLMENPIDKIIRVEIRQINGHEVQLRVADRGPGIPADRAEDIFEPNYSGSRDRSGRGLAICKMIADTHGGRIEYRPSPSGGAIFELTLQRAAE